MPELAGFRVECETLCRQPMSRLTINVDNLSTFDELSPIVDHKVSIMREGLANLLPRVRALITTVRNCESRSFL